MGISQCHSQVAYNSGAQYAAELIPTCVRGQGVAAAHVAGYALTFFSSYILYTVGNLKYRSNIWSWRAFTPLFILSRLRSSRQCHRLSSAFWALPVRSVVFFYLKHLIGKPNVRSTRTGAYVNEKPSYKLKHKPFIVIRKTPVTLQEGEDFGKGEKFFHFACFDKIQRKNDSVVLS